MITVMFSSRNGARHLRKVMDGFAALEAPRGGWKLVAVDNDSSDGTGEILKSFSGLTPLTVITEPVAGKNRALNAALEHAEGNFYIFTDDDVLVKSDWLVKWREIADAKPAFDLFAGCTRAHWPFDPPRKLLDGVNVNVLFATHNGINEGPCSAACMHGTNMAVRASVFQGVQFNTAIGPDGTGLYAMGSDTEMALRLESRGLRCWFAEGPYVEHIVRPEQFDQSWILRRGYRWGRGLAQMRLPYPEAVESVARKNSLKSLIYPVLLPLLPWKDRWRRQWHNAVDRGFEDGSRETRGLKRRWA